MGNRAVITTNDDWLNYGIGVYLHWNGGRDSVEAFLKYCEMKGYRPPSEDDYGYARLVQVIANFFGGQGSIGIACIPALDCDNGDNGTYIIDGWNIVDRKFFNGREQNQHDLIEMLKAIDECQPEREQLGSYIYDEDVDVSDLKVGDEVWINEYDGTFSIHTILGFGADEVHNGTNVKGLPYVDLYKNDGVYTWNINNYITKKRIKVHKRK